MLWPPLLLFLPYSLAFFTCPQPPCPCFPLDRPEVRQLSVEQRAKVSSAFRNARHLVPKTAWNQPGKTMCLLVNSLDASLRPDKFPYWDSRIEERMDNPKDSFIFLGRFFPDKSMRRRRRSKDRRASSDLIAPSTMSPRLFSALRAGRHSQLLSFMYSVGLQMKRFVNDTCEGLCNENTEFLSCSQGKCWSKLRSGSICSENGLPACYNSICINNICSIPSKKEKAQLQTYEVIENEGLTIVRLPDEARRKTQVVDIGKNMNGNNTNLEGSGEEESATNVYEFETKTTLQTTTIGVGVFAIENVQEPLAFNMTLPFPTVYVPISIMKRRQIRRHLVDNTQEFIIVSEGKNLPSGYTQKINGLMSNSTRALVRLLDPMLATLAIEATISVTLDSKLCEASCLVRKDVYKPCKNVLRLSRYPKISDPVQWYKEIPEVPTTFTGSGYYKRPPLDYMLFRCT